MRKLVLAWLALGAAAGCGGRPDAWDASASTPLDSEGLTGSVSVVDRALDRVLMLTASSNGALFETPLRVGKHVASVEPSHDRSKLFVLSRGVQPRRSSDDEWPSLTVIDGGSEPTVLSRYTLSDPLEGLAVDPAGEWVVVYASSGIVENPNELIFVKLDEPGAEPVSKTIRSFGGKPKRVSFTGELAIPKGAPRRFALVETDLDVAFIDLSELLTREEITLPLAKTPNAQPGKPAEVAFHGGNLSDGTGARIAVRLENDSNLMLFELAPAAAGDDKPFETTVNVADVGSVPTSIAFVQTDGGLRLAALTPDFYDEGKPSPGAALVDPATTTVERVDFPKRFDQIARITEDITDQPSKSDVALLWSDKIKGIAFWSLGKSSGTPFRSVDDYAIDISVAKVRSVPGTKYAHLKILESASSKDFYVLDLDERQSFPMITNASGFEVGVSPDGERAWALRTGTPYMASIDLSNLHPTSIIVERQTLAVYDIARRDAGRAAIALHVSQGSGALSLGATVLDALDPDTAKSRFYGGLMLGGLAE